MVYLLPVLALLRELVEEEVFLEEDPACEEAGRLEVIVPVLLLPRLPEKMLPEGLLPEALLPPEGLELCTLDELLLFLEGVAAGAGRLGLAGLTAGLLEPLAGVLVFSLLLLAAGRLTVLPAGAAGRLTLSPVFLAAEVAGEAVVPSRLTRLPVVVPRLLPEGMVVPREWRTASTLLYSARPSLMASGRL